MGAMEFFVQHLQRFFPTILIRYVMRLYLWFTFQWKLQGNLVAVECERVKVFNYCGPSDLDPGLVLGAIHSSSFMLFHCLTSS